MNAVPATLAQVSCETREKEAGGGGVTKQAGRVQQCTAQGRPGKVGGVHRRWDLLVFPTRSASGCIVFIVRVSFSLRVLVISQVTLYARGWPLLRGDFPPPVDSLRGRPSNDPDPVARVGDFPHRQREAAVGLWAVFTMSEPGHFLALARQLRHLRRFLNSRWGRGFPPSTA